LARSELITDLVAEHGVSRKFVYGLNGCRKRWRVDAALQLIRQELAHGKALQSK